MNDTNNQTLTQVQLKECPFCAEHISVNAKKCKHCSETLDVTMRMAEDYKNNMQSGNNLMASPMMQQGNHVQKSRVTFVILDLFLCYFGVHNFYAGYNGRGIAQLLITLLIGWTIIPLFAVSLWGFIELFVTTKDARGIPFN